MSGGIAFNERPAASVRRAGSEGRAALAKSFEEMTESAAERAEWFGNTVVDMLPGLYATALRLAKNRADAEDLVAESVAQAWSALDSLRDKGAFRGWIFRILSNCFVSNCRARRARPQTEPFPDDDGSAEDFSLFERLHQPFLLWSGNPEQEFLDHLLREDVERAVDAVPEAYRLTVVLVDLEGFSYQEAAQALDVPIGTVRSRLARGRSLLQRALWTQAEDAGWKRPYSEAPPQ
jgi:RNA polymerase sigma-70 factor (ECF subfamily)